MSGKRKFYYLALFIISMAWYILWAFLIEARFYGQWAAYALAGYLSCFLEVGIEKFFYVKTYQSDEVISKFSTALFSVAIPAYIAECFGSIARLNGMIDDRTLCFCCVTACTLWIRLVFWVIEKLVEKYKRK